LPAACGGFFAIPICQAPCYVLLKGSMNVFGQQRSHAQRGTQEFCFLHQR
jgi:hypothetical protein